MIRATLLTSLVLYNKSQYIILAVVKNIRLGCSLNYNLTSSPSNWASQYETRSWLPLNYPMDLNHCFPLFLSSQKLWNKVDLGEFQLSSLSAKLLQGWLSTLISIIYLRVRIELAPSLWVWF